MKIGRLHDRVEGVDKGFRTREVSGYLRLFIPTLIALSAGVVAKNVDSSVHTKSKLILA